MSSRNPNYNPNTAATVPRDFLCNLPVDRPALTASIQHTWQATTQSTSETTNELTQRAENSLSKKYSQEEWNRRF